MVRNQLKWAVLVCPDMRIDRSRIWADLSPWVVVCAALIFGFALDRYPSHYVDESLFMFAAARAAAGGPFVYALSSHEPFGNIVWAAHGPLVPHIVYLLYKVFGFSLLVSRLPDYVGAWLAVLLIVLFLRRRGYRYAGFVLAILWCGDRAWQEVMYARVEGVALLFVALAFLAIERLWRLGEIRSSFWAGLAFGCSCLAQPFCLFFAALGFLWTMWLGRVRAALLFLAGGLVSVPLLFWMWGFHIHDAIAQFRWHVAEVGEQPVLPSVATLFRALMWSRYWQVVLVTFGLACAIVAAVHLYRAGRQWSWWADFALAASFALVGIRNIFHARTMPYYIVYYSIWAMLCLVIAAEKEWRRMRPIVFIMGVVWCSSAAWNLMRARETVIFHRTLSRNFERNLLLKNVPSNEEIVTTPDLFSVPIDDGYRRYDVTYWFGERQEVCPSCYLLLTREDYQKGSYVAQDNLDRRKILYDGPAFPGAGPLAFPIMLLSPEGGNATGQ